MPWAIRCDNDDDSYFLLRINHVPLATYFKYIIFYSLFNHVSVAFFLPLVLWRKIRDVE